ncbi:MAG: type IX secretion system sortase PorU [Bacteroidetes bacterium]|nr:MAG: type IX secretion system sortase PorU [Bacteroidota bacterium]
MFWSMKIKSFLSVCFLSLGMLFSFVLGQQSLDLKVEWMKGIPFEQAGVQLVKPQIKGQEFSAYRPAYSKRIKAPKGTSYNVQVKQVETVLASNEDISYLKAFAISIPKKLEWTSKTTNAGKQRFLQLYFFPYLIEGGTLKKVLQVHMELEPVKDVQVQNKDFVASSVLGDQGSRWYKISLEQDGVYKLDYEWFQQHQISVSGLSPDHIHLYGNASGKIPEDNSVPKTDDLAENAIQFVGDADASFEPGEYFLFYGWGPHKWSQVGGTFRRDLHLYSDQSHYFIRISDQESPERIQNNSLSTLPVTNTVDEFNYFTVHERDSVNLVGGGQRWYGELFDFDLTQDFPFSIPDIVPNSTVHFITSLASNSRSSSNKYDISVNGSSLNSGSIPSISTDYRRMEVFYDYQTSSDQVTVRINVNRVNPTVLTYLDRIELNARRKLVFHSGQMQFRDFNSVGAGNVADFKVTGVPQDYSLWEVTNRTKPGIITGDWLNGELSFKLATDSLREFILFDGNVIFTPKYVGEVASQNLHALPPAKFLIVTHPAFMEQAERLADLHRAENVSTHVVTTTQVYNEFSSGTQDPGAIKWFAKMFYDRANGDPSRMPENLLLFGDGTYDPKDRLPGNNNMVPTYQFISSEDHINALVTDDFFGMLDDNESIGNSDMLDIGVGRMIVTTTQQAKEQVDKVEQYMKKGIQQNNGLACNQQGVSCSSYGDWRLKYVQIADDEENGYFIVNDTEPQNAQVETNYPDMNVDKLYMDAYPQVTNAGGQRYPEVVAQITDRVQRGALVVNYVGHGGEVGLAEERVVTIPQIQSWTNWCHLNLFVSATCEFTRFDDPSRVSAGEWAFLNSGGGAIALMTTTRSVFFGVNTNVGKSFYQHVFERDSNNKPLTFGEIMKNTKNDAGSNSNKRSFNLIGDPALRIALPEYRITVDSINGISPDQIQDTLKALSKVRIKGHVEDYTGTTLNDFEGVLSSAIYDKKKTNKTLGQDEKSPVLEFSTQKNQLYKGRSSIEKGYFDFEFVVPKDIDYSLGLGKISLYAESETRDAAGSETRVYVGGINPDGIADNQGPEVSMYFNNEKFINGGLTDENPILYAQIYDENGVNMVGNGIGHDILAVLDDNTGDPIVLNDYYNASMDTYQSGELIYQFRNLEPGVHRLSLKVWDVNNNSSETEIEFEVQKKEKLELRHVLNYPNPFTTSTAFYFEHNQWCSPLTAQVQIFTISGKLVKTISVDVLNDCYRSDAIQWDGKDDFGDQLAKGVYVYKLTVRNTSNEIAEKIEKCVILK